MTRFNLLLVLIFFLSYSLANAQQYPQRSAEFVNDFADLLDPQAEQRLNASQSELKQNRDVEMTVVTIESTRQFGYQGEIEPFATGLFNTWGLGNPSRNDGILMLIASTDREMRIELGAGYPEEMNNTAKTIIEEIMIPEFRNGNYAQGIEKGVNEAKHLIRLEGSPLNPSQLLTPNQNSNDHLMSILKWGGGISVGIITTILGLFQINKWSRRRPRHCPKCKSTMELLPEETEDTYLTDGQESEERVNSIQYDVWHCPMDGTVQVCNYQKWFSGYCKCKFCSRQTLSSNSETLSPATEYSTGIEEVTYNCEHCEKNWIERRTIPRITRTHSSNSGSSGGRSSGGGASGRW